MLSFADSRHCNLNVYIQKEIFCETFLYAKKKNINTLNVTNIYIYFLAQILRSLLSNKNGILNC